jgi:polyphosphate kinase
VSDRISVRSIVGRFLEHSRIFYFGNGGEEEIYLSSADWMPRNLYERVEVMFPLTNPMLRERVKREMLDAYLADNVKTRVLLKDGSYIPAWRAGGKRKPPMPGERFSAQDFLIAVAEGKRIPEPIPESPRLSARRRSRIERKT